MDGISNSLIVVRRKALREKYLSTGSFCHRHGVCHFYENKTIGGGELILESRRSLAMIEKPRNNLV